MEDKLYNYMTNSIHFTGKKNFDKLQASYANTDEFDAHRHHINPKSSMWLSEIRESEPGVYRPFKEDEMKQISQMAKKKQDEFEVPFDEIYHKERKLV